VLSYRQHKMATAESHISIPPERRRSERLSLALPVLVFGTSLDSKSFQENTITLSVSTHGALLALSTTVTLGQPLLLRNPQTQQESEAWVSRFAHPRGGLSQVGIAFVRPEDDFWSSKKSAFQTADQSAPNSLDMVATQSDEKRPNDGVLMFSNPSANRTDDATTDDARIGADLQPSEVPTQALTAQASASDMSAPARQASNGALLYALEQTLRQAADHAVAYSASASLGPAVNHAASAIENFTQAQIQQMEERLAQRHQELVTSAREQIQSALAEAEDRLRKHSTEYVEEAADNAHRDFAQRLTETSNQVSARVAEDAIGSSAQHFAKLAYDIHIVSAEAQSQIESSAAAIADSHASAKNELDRALADAQQKFELLAMQVNGAYATCDARIRAFQDELAQTKEQELNNFRDRLRTVLTTLLNALG
jgi:hypothetical protein